MKRSRIEFTIIVVYVDDINFIGTSEEIPKAINLLKKKFEIKDIENKKLCLGLQIEHLDNEIFVHQEGYVEKMLKVSNMDKSCMSCAHTVLEHWMCKILF